MQDKIKGSLFGYFVGDALGVPHEFKSRSSINNGVTDMDEFGTHNQPRGTWSDDSSMVLATLTSLIDKKEIDYNDIMSNYVKWYKRGVFTPFNEVFDIGNGTRMSLDKYDGSNYKCGLDDIYSNGNGSLMRVLPISIYLHFTNDQLFDVVKNFSSMTHAHIYSVFSCIIYTVYINEYLKSSDKINAYISMQNIIKSVLENEQYKEFLGDTEDLKNKFNRIIYNDISKYGVDEIKSSGYVIDTLEAAFWCLLTTDNYKDSVLKAVNLGDDTDTVGAITGSLSGLVYSFESIPENWINNLQRLSYLKDLTDRYIGLINELITKSTIKDWTNNTESNIEEEIATKDSFKSIPFTSYDKVKVDITLNKDEFELLKKGHIAREMEDHWNMYTDDNSINYLRSWTGIQIFKALYKFENDSYLIYELDINNNKEEYNEEDINQSVELFKKMLRRNL